MCDNCAALRAENTALRAILYPEPDKERIFLLAQRLRIRPQDARVLSRLMDSPGEVVPHVALQRASGYGGDIGSYAARQNMSQKIAKIRAALPYIGMKTTDLRNWHTRGYALSLEAAKKLEAIR